MIPYDRNIDPPAPFVEVIIRHPTTGVREVLSAQHRRGAISQEVRKARNPFRAFRILSRLS